MMVERKVFSMEMRNNVYEKTKGNCAENLYASICLQ